MPSIHDRRPSVPACSFTVAALAAASAVVSLAGAAPPSFVDQTIAAAVQSTHDPRYSMSFAAGGTVADFNGDGWQDIFHAVGGGGPDQLFINNRDGTFTESAAAWGIALAHRSTAGVAGDYDGDGDIDLYVTSLGPAGASQTGFHKLYRNNGDETFTDVAASAGVERTSTASADGWGGAWGDYDLDGDLDLAVAGWASSDGNRLFRNNGDGTFADVSALLGNMAGVSGFAPRFVDMDGDRYPELIWVADFATGRYFVNNGDGTFTNFTGPAGVNLDGTEMGATVADIDEDGDFDFYVSTINSNNLYLNDGDNTFTNVAAGAGVASGGWGWAVVAVDMDHDTYIDLLQAEHGGNHRAWRNTSGGGSLDFDEMSNAIGITGSEAGRGLSNFDYDNDGDQDLVFFSYDDQIRLYRNEVAGAVDAGWLRVFLDPAGATDIAPNGIGAVVEVSFGGRTLIGRIDGGSNYLSQSEMSAHFGLGTAAIIDEVRVAWPNGAVTVVADVAVNQTLTLEPPAACPGDLSGPNGAVDFGDLLAVLSAWGTPDGDVSGDGQTAFDDILVVLSGWGPCP
ncbi:MAG: CRTAC1 family protein [Phycisphaerales bacterium]